MRDESSKIHRARGKRRPVGELASCKLCEQPVEPTDDWMQSSDGDEAHKRCVELERHPPTLDTLHSTFREGLVVFEAFRRLGIPAEDIHAGEREGTLMIAVIRDEQLYGVQVGALPDMRFWRTDWKAAANWWNDENISDVDRDQLWGDARVHAAWPDLLASWVTNGLQLPVMVD